MDMTPTVSSESWLEVPVAKSVPRLPLGNKTFLLEKERCMVPMLRQAESKESAKEAASQQSDPDPPHQGLSHPKTSLQPPKREACA